MLVLFVGSFVNAKLNVDFSGLSATMKVSARLQRRSPVFIRGRVFFLPLNSRKRPLVSKAMKEVGLFAALKWRNQEYRSKV